MKLIEEVRKTSPDMKLEVRATVFDFILESNYKKYLTAIIKDVKSINKDSTEKEASDALNLSLRTIRDSIKIGKIN